MLTIKKICFWFLAIASPLFSLFIFILMVAFPMCSRAGGIVSTASQSALTSALAGGGTVTFAFNGTITLTSVENISANTVIDGSGYNVIISGGNTSQIFKVGSGVSLMITNLTLQNGLTTTNGGAIYNLGTLTAGNCIFNNNNAKGTNGASGVTSGQPGATGENVNGGAVYSAGVAVFENCTFCTNSAIGGSGGNGVVGASGYSAGSGGAGGGGGTAQGGAIYNSGTVAITNCFFFSNSSEGGVGGTGGAGGLDTGNGEYEGAGSGGVGGLASGVGLYTTGSSIVVQSTFAYNSGIGGTSGNSGSIGGPIHGASGQGAGITVGAGICNMGTNTTINCTFYANALTAGSGGNASNGEYNGVSGGNGGNAYGGGIYNTNVATITNCTFSSNILIAGEGGAEGTGPDGNGNPGPNGIAEGGAIKNASGSLTLKNSIIAYSQDTGGSGTTGNGSGTITDAGNNISSDTSITLSGVGSLANTDPQLLPMANNGGFTETCALQSTSPAINAGDDTAAPFTDQRNYFRVGVSDIGACEYGASGMYADALGYTASLNGNVGLFLIGGLYTPSPIPLNVSYTMGGTASNGVDYTYVTNSLTIPAGSDHAIVLIQGVPGAFSITNKTVSLTINSWNNVILSNTSETLILYPNNTYDMADRYVRGTSTAEDYQSLVLPMDSEVGVPLDNIGGNATNFFPNNPWTNTLYHFDATNLVPQTNIVGRIPFQNPIVAFGDTVGGSSLYINRTYNFTIASGYPANLTNALCIQAYYRSNSAYAGTIDLTIPSRNQLMNLVTNGFTETFTGFGLQTVVSISDPIDWQVHGLQWGESFTVAHEAFAEATNYYYVVENEGYGPYQYLVLNETNSATWSPLYVMEFSPYPNNLSTFLTEPQFNGAPMPSSYEGATLQELTNVQAVLPNLSYLNPSNYLTLDDSPELRRHPILDQFVKNMNNDPLALVNYVINQIGLVDGIDVNTNAIMQSSINLGGINRSALDTFQEGQGSPTEQCALLVYLLRQAGVPAAYVFPTNNGLQMLSSQMSEILQCQLTGALNYYGQTNIPAQIDVNYPWVAAYIGTNWVQIFPWIKDTKITEGFNLYDYMPTNYNSGYKWLTHFIANDTNIFSLSSSDQPLDLLPLFIQKSLDQNYPGMSVSDLGMQVVNRQHLYSQWADFPKPFALSGIPTIVESLGSNTNLFNTIEVRVYSQANPSKFIDTGIMYAADLHNRMILLQFQQVGTNNVHNMILSLEPYSTNYTSVTSFGANANPCWGLSSTNQLNSTDNGIAYQITQQRDRFLPPNFTQNIVGNVQYYAYDYFEFGQQGTSQIYQNSENYNKGDLVAFAFDDGMVSQRMLNVHAQQIWQFNQNANTNVPSTLNPNIYLGETTYLMAMSYFNYVDRFNQFDGLLHKVHAISSYRQGFGLLRPKRDSTGALVNGGEVIPITPAVNMPIGADSDIFNYATMANLNNDTYTTELSWYLLSGLQGSAAEHGVLRSYYGTNAISTVKLLQQAGTNTVLLDQDSYLAAGQISYHGVELMNSDTNIWVSITNFFSPDNYYGNDYDEEVFMTPGAMTNGTYIGVGALLMNNYYFQAAVGGFNGGYANSFPTTTFSPDNSPNLTVNPAPDDSVAPFLLATSQPIGNNNLIDGSSTLWTLPSTDSSLADNQAQVDPSLGSASTSLSELYGTAGNSASLYSQIYNTGAASSSVPVYSDSGMQVSDPVNMMTGEFYIDAPDITLPGPMPLQIRRNYGSQNLTENQFGFGWKMNYFPFLSVGTNSTLIYACEMDGTVVAYRRNIANTNLWLPQSQDNPMLNNDSSIGIGSIGNLYNNRIVESAVNGTNVYTLTGADGSIRTFSIQSFPIGTFTRQRPYLNIWHDSRGNFYNFQYGEDSTQPDYGQVNRIQSSNGNFVGFYYDVYGRIIQAYTGDGRWLQYVYDKYGDLTTVTLPDQTEIDYLYQHANMVTNSVTNVYSTHLIVEEDKPDGRILQNIYDNQRRVTNQLSTAGVSLTPITTASFSYTNNFSLNTPTNPVTGVTAISDYFGHTTTYFYTNSMVQKTVDPLNQIITQTWYPTNGAGGFQRSLASRIDKRGLLTTYLYDIYGNLTNTIVTGDLTGNGVFTQAATNTASYNTNNLPIQITDAVGNSTVVVYDPVFTFLPQQTIRYAGATPVVTNLMIYGNTTNVVVDGSMTQTNMAFGVLTRLIRAYGSPDAATNDSFCNGQGFPTNTVQYTGTDDSNVINQLFYDERDELVQRTDTAGNTYTFAFDPMGRKTAQDTYVAGQTSPMDFDYWYYDDNGEVNWIDGPRYNPEDYVFYDYDGAGRPTTEIHWLSQANSAGTGVQAPAGYNQFAQTFNQYDPLGNVLVKTDPRGAETTNVYDALCRLVQTTHLDTNGISVLSTDSYSYEPGGQVQSHTNALGGVTTTYYTTTGKPEYRINADGSTNAWRYYLDGRIYQKIQRNGAYWQTTYNDVNLTTTQTFYSAAGVPEATNSVQLDRRGNTIQKTDEGGNIFLTAYDGLDRVVGTTGPNSSGGTAEQTTTTHYDSTGLVSTNINALGEELVSIKDAIGRPTTNLIYSASGTLVREVYYTYSADHNSVTTTIGSGANAFTNTSFTDTEGHEVLSIQNPSFSSQDFTIKGYDLSGNLVSSEHASSAGGVITNWTDSAYQFDGLNRMVSSVDRDSAVTTFAYDPLDDVTNRTMPGGLQWQTTYNSAGQITQEQILGGSQTTRTITYDYYRSGSPFVGLLDAEIDGRGIVGSYAYDDFLRKSSIVYVGSKPEQDMTVSWQYEPRSLVTNYSTSFSRLTTGPKSTVLRSYDAYGQLASESTTIGTNSYNSTQTWDGEGRRTSLSIANQEYSYGWQADGNLASVNDDTGEGFYNYDTAGLLTNRYVRSSVTPVDGRNTDINSRDGEGRPLAISTTLNGVPEMSESLTWSGDGLLLSHTLLRPDFTDSRQYAYANLSRRLLQEQFNLNSTSKVTNNYAYDRGLPSGPGVLTQAGENGTLSNVWDGATDLFSRINLETNDVIESQAFGYVNGQASLNAWLDNNAIAITSTGTNSMQWQAPMELSPGTHQLVVMATHPDGYFTTSATNTFTNGIASENAVDSYDGSGNVTNRVWKNASGVVERSQSLSWDALGRLYSVSERNSTNSGYNWNAFYDALNRRLQTTTILVTNGLVVSGLPITINQYYDPDVKLLELGNAVNNGPVIWKLYGPDLNGVYGGANGTGGFEGFSPVNTVFDPVIADFRGNILAEITNGAAIWNSARPTGYGAAPGFRSPSFGSGVDISIASAWRGKWSDLTGYFQIGARTYDPVSGKWLSYDSNWNPQDPNYMSFCGGDPINSFDSNGAQPVGYSPPPWESQPGQAVTVFQDIFPATAIAAGARPITGSPNTDITMLQQPFDSTLLPALQVESAFAMTVLTGPIGGGAEGTITWTSVGGAVVRGAVVNAAASGTVADLTGQPIGPAIYGGLATGAITGGGGEFASVLSPVGWMSLNMAAGFTGNYAGNSIEQYSDTGKVNWGESFASGTFGAVMSAPEGNFTSALEDVLPEGISSSLTYKILSDYSVEMGDSSLESFLKPPESPEGGESESQNSENQQPSPAYTQGPLGSKH